MNEEKKSICILTQELAKNFWDERISEEAKEAITSHLSECSSCQKRYDEIKKDIKRMNTNKDDRNHYVQISRMLKHRRIRNISIASALVISVFILFQICFISALFPGGMESTISAGEKCYTFRMSYVFGEPKQRDIVMFKHNNFCDISRIVAVPGDIVEIKNGNLYVNGQIVSGYEGITADSESVHYIEGTFKIEVPEGQYFIIGDDFEKSYDSRYDSYGCVERNDIYGKVLLHTGSWNPFVKQTYVETSTTVEGSEDK